MNRLFLMTLLNFLIISFTNAQFDDKFYSPSKKWNKIDNLNYEEIEYNIDSVKLNCLLLKPGTTPKATIIFFHGSSGNVTSYLSMVKPLVKNSYQVFMFEPRGYGKSTGTPTHLNIASDAQYVFEQLLTRKDISSTRIIVYGASMGSQIAVKIAKDNTEKLSGLILDGTISSFTDIALSSVPEDQKKMIRQYVTSPYSAKEDIKSIKNLPKLFVHSITDESVPYSQAQTVFENALEPKKMWNYEGKHLEAIVKYPELYIEKINSILKESVAKKFKLNIKIDKLKSNKGKVVLQLSDLNGNAIAQKCVKIRENKCSVTFKNIPKGKYTINYFHDENDDNELNTGFMGIPKEGYGFSNNASSRFGQPPVEELLFDICGDVNMLLSPTYISF